MDRDDLIEIMARVIRTHLTDVNRPLSREVAAAILSVFKAQRIRLFRRRLAGAPPPATLRRRP